MSSSAHKASERVQDLGKRRGCWRSRLPNQQRRWQEDVLNSRRQRAAAWPSTKARSEAQDARQEAYSGSNDIAQHVSAL